MSLVASAQDIHFTQYFSAPLTLNPALAGLIQQDIRLSANYRSQWASVSANPYTTMTASVDAAILKGKLADGDALGVGALMIYDKSGSGALTNTTAAFNIAYHKGFGRDKLQHISLGVQAGMVSKAIDYSNLIFADGINTSTGTIITGATPGVGNINQSLSYMDINVGAMWSGKVNEHTMLYAGTSYNHVTSPTENFIENGSHNIHPKTNVYLGGNFNLTDRTTLYTTGLYQTQAKATEVMVGAAFGYIMNSDRDMEYARNTIFYMGGFYRHSDAISPYVAIEWAKAKIGLNYDINGSRFSTATNGMGALEVSFIYFGNINRYEKAPEYNWSCPKVW